MSINIQKKKIWILTGCVLIGIASSIWAFLRHSPSLSPEPTKMLYYREDATRSVQFPRQPIHSTEYGIVDLDKEQWNFVDLFFSEEIALRDTTADGIVVYHQGYEYLSYHQNPPLYGRTAFQRGFFNTITDAAGHLLFLEPVNGDVVVWELFTESLRETFPHILDHRDIISLGYHPQSRYCGILYQDFELEVVNHAGESILSYTSQTPLPQDTDFSGLDQNIYFRNPHTLYFFDRTVLIKVDLTSNTVTPLYTVTDLEKHSGYNYNFNAFTNTVTIFSEYCAGCDIGGKILVLDIDTLMPINRLSTREYGQSLSFCKYYVNKFVTASHMFETFMIHEIDGQDIFE